MHKNKYPINSEFFPFNKFTPRISKGMIRLAQKYMNVPSFVWKDKEISAEKVTINSYENGEIDLIIITPINIKTPAPCFINIHGGGYVFEGTPSHFRHAVTYAKKAECVVVYVRYRLAPEFHFPVQQEDCYAAYLWICEHCIELNIDPLRIGIGGDSAGGTLSVTTCFMARDRNAGFMPLFQLLIYPWLDGRNVSESSRKYTDTPMWNSSLSKSVTPFTDPNPEKVPIELKSPVEAQTFSGLPKAYIEVAEFDPLHDDGVYYAEKLENEGIEVELHETKGTMHGFDTKVSAPTTQKMLKNRVSYMKKMFYDIKE